MGTFFNNVDRSDLRVGDHVYSWRTGYTYAHHGIYVGDNDVVHFTKGSNEPELAAKASLIESIGSSSIPKQQYLSCPRYPDSCVLKCENGGVICSCLDCFLEGGSVYRFKYGVSKAEFFAQVRGNCTVAQSDPPDRVVHRARYLHQQNGFGNYDLFSNNCEDFAIYCKTEFVVISRNASGRSGQVAVVKSFCSALSEAYMQYLLSVVIMYVPIISAPLLSLTYKPIYNIGKALKFAKNYFCERYEADIGVRRDKIKIPVEDLAVYLHLSTGINVDKTKVAVEDSAVSLDSSISIRDDKSKVPVEDVSVFLDSSNGKKPPVEDLAVYLDSSTGKRFDKTKVPVEDAAAFLDSSTGKKPPVEDLAVYPDSSTGNRVDKIMAPVEDVAAVFLDSPTDKTSPVAESSTSQAISRNISSKNQKRKLRQQQRRKCQLVQDVEDVAVVLDSSTGKKPLVAESCTSQATSGNGSCKKQKEKLLQQQRRNCQLVQDVDDVGVVLDSSTGKKPLVAESCTSQTTSRNGSSKKQKKKLPEQQRRNCQLVQAVEDVSVVLDSSTGKKPLVAESCTSQTTSRNESSKKQKKKPLQQQRRNCQLVQDMDDVGVVLDSSIGKKPPVAESSTSQATSRNGSSKKDKKKLREKQRRNCQLVQDVEDVAVVLDSSTGKKPAVAESSTSQATSRNGSSKKKLSQQQRRNCEFVQGPVPRGPVLEGN